MTLEHVFELPRAFYPPRAYVMGLAAMSHDGKTVALVRDHRAGGLGLACRVDTGKILTFWKEKVTIPPWKGGFARAVHAPPVLSYDGSRVAFQINSTSWQWGRGIVVVDTTARRRFVQAIWIHEHFKSVVPKYARLMHHGHFDFSGDGKVLFVSYRYFEKGDNQNRYPFRCALVRIDVERKAATLVGIARTGTMCYPFAEPRTNQSGSVVCFFGRPKGGKGDVGWVWSRGGSIRCPMPGPRHVGPIPVGTVHSPWITMVRGHHILHERWDGKGKRFYCDENYGKPGNFSALARVHRASSRFLSYDGNHAVYAAIGAKPVVWYDFTADRSQGRGYWVPMQKIGPRVVPLGHTRGDPVPFLSHDGRRILMMRSPSRYDKQTWRLVVAQVAPPGKKPDGKVGLGGLWRQLGPGSAKSTIIAFQKGQILWMMGHSTIGGGRGTVWRGEGKIQGRVVRLFVHHADDSRKAPSAAPPPGTIILKLSEGGRRLTGRKVTFLRVNP